VQAATTLGGGGGTERRVVARTALALVESLEADAVPPGFMSSAGSLLNDLAEIGKASLNQRMGSRVAAHDRRKPRAPWRDDAALLYFVAVTEPFEAPSLEEFLRRQLHPKGNKL
jgi:hypothetical protein